jgi:hypothetical protein
MTTDLELRYDHPDSQTGRGAARPPSLTATDLERRYDHPDSQAGRPTAPAPAAAPATAAVAVPEAAAPDVHATGAEERDFIESIRSRLTEAGLDEGVREKALGFYAAEGRAWVEAQEARVAAWESEVKADPSFAQWADGARAAFREIGGTDLLRELNDTGLGSHPGMVKIAVRLAQLLGGQR